MNGAGSVSIFVSQLFDKNILPLFIKISLNFATNIIRIWANQMTSIPPERTRKPGV